MEWVIAGLLTIVIGVLIIRYIVSSALKRKFED